MATLQCASIRSTPICGSNGGSRREVALSATSELTAVLDQFVSELTQRGWPAADIFGIRLAVEEAVVNGIKHGHQHDATKQVRLRYRLQADSFLAEVEDEGPGFDPHQVPDPTEPENLCRPCGRGVFLMRHYMTWVRFNDQGNCVTLCKYRTVE